MWRCLRCTARASTPPSTVVKLLASVERDHSLMSVGSRRPRLGARDTCRLLSTRPLCPSTARRDMQRRLDRKDRNRNRSPKVHIPKSGHSLPCLFLCRRTQCIQSRSTPSSARPSRHGKARLALSSSMSKLTKSPDWGRPSLQSFTCRNTSLPLKLMKPQPFASLKDLTVP